MSENIKWGVLGTGKVARLFVEGMEAVAESEISAVASRSEKRAKSFAEEYSLPHSFGSYEALAESDVDIVYVATPQSEHLANTLMCLENKRHVLCEKPLALNARQAQRMIETARSKGLFLMEGMWMHTFPGARALTKTLDEDSIGEIRLVRITYGFAADKKKEHRVFEPECGGGSLMDLGVYGVALAQRILGGEPTEITATAHIGKSGVDEQCSLTMRYDSGALANILCSIAGDWLMGAVIEGTKGRILIPGKISRLDGFTVVDRVGIEERVHYDRLGNGYSFEAAEVVGCLRDGRLESEQVPLEESLAVLRTLDRVRKLWKLEFPGE
jgi:predicted dehydrogenase